MNVAIHMHSLLGLTLFIKQSMLCVLGVRFLKKLLFSVPLYNYIIFIYIFTC